VGIGRQHDVARQASTTPAPRGRRPHACTDTPCREPGELQVLRGWHRGAPREGWAV